MRENENLMPLAVICLQPKAQYVKKNFLAFLSLCSSFVCFSQQGITSFHPCNPYTPSIKRRETEMNKFQGRRKNDAILEYENAQMSSWCSPLPSSSSSQYVFFFLLFRSFNVTENRVPSIMQTILVYSFQISACQIVSLPHLYTISFVTVRLVVKFGVLYTCFIVKQLCRLNNVNKMLEREGRMFSCGTIRWALFLPNIARYLQ